MQRPPTHPFGFASAHKDLGEFWDIVGWHAAEVTFGTQVLRAKLARWQMNGPLTHHRRHRQQSRGNSMGLFVIDLYPERIGP